MALLYNLARMTTTTTGTGTITLTGTATGFLSFASAGVSDGDIVSYAIQDGSNSEIGYGTYSTTGPTLTRTVRKSTNSDTAISLSGSAEVFITPSADNFIFSNQNCVINGDFQINQRGFTSGAVTAGAYFFDRWKAATGGANVSLSGFVLTLNSGAIEQVIEPTLWGLSSFASMDVTISVDSPSKDLGVSFASQSGTISAGSGRCSVTLSIGSVSGSQTLQIDRSADDVVTFGRVKLEVGSAATDWADRPDALERRLCYRYYQKTYPEGTAPGTNMGSTFNGLVGGGFMSTAVSTTNFWEVNIPFAYPMRTTPTMVSYDRAGTSGKAVYYAVVGTSYSDGYTVTLTASSRSFYAYSDNSTTKSGMMFHYTADAEL